MLRSPRYILAKWIGAGIAGNGRIERTLQAWLEQPQLRRQTTAALDRIESPNALSGCRSCHTAESVISGLKSGVETARHCN